MKPRALRATHRVLLTELFTKPLARHSPAGMTLRDHSSHQPHSWPMGVSGIVPGKIMERPGNVRPAALWITLLETIPLFTVSQILRNSTSQIMKRLWTVRLVAVEWWNSTSQIMKRPGTVRPAALWTALIETVPLFTVSQILRNSTSQIMKRLWTVRLVAVEWWNSTSQIMKRPGTVRPAALWTALIETVPLFTVSQILRNSTSQILERPGTVRPAALWIALLIVCQWRCFTCWRILNARDTHLGQTRCSAVSLCRLWWRSLNPWCSLVLDDLKRDGKTHG